MILFLPFKRGWALWSALLRWVSVTRVFGKRKKKQTAIKKLFLVYEKKYFLVIGVNFSSETVGKETGHLNKKKKTLSDTHKRGFKVKEKSFHYYYPFPESQQTLRSTQ